MENQQELLAHADQQIAEYKRHVAEQGAKVAELSAKGPPPEDAVDVLKQLEEMLRIAEKQRDLVLRKLQSD